MRLLHGHLVSLLCQGRVASAGLVLLEAFDRHGSDPRNRYWLESLARDLQEHPLWPHVPEDIFQLMLRFASPLAASHQSVVGLLLSAGQGVPLPLELSLWPHGIQLAPESRASLEEARGATLKTLATALPASFEPDDRAWSLDLVTAPFRPPTPLTIHGVSLAAAWAVLYAAYLLDLPLEGTLAFSARVDAAGRLQPVEGIAAKTRSLCQQTPRVTALLVSRSDEPQARETAGSVLPVHGFDRLDDLFAWLWGSGWRQQAHSNLTTPAEQLARLWKAHRAGDQGLVESLGQALCRSPRAQEPLRFQATCLLYHAKVHRGGAAEVIDSFLGPKGLVARGRELLEGRRLPPGRLVQLMAMASVTAGDCGLLDRAEALAKEAWQLASSCRLERHACVPALGTLGRTLIRTGKPEEGLEFLRQALDWVLPEERPRNLNVLGIGLRLAGRPEEALCMHVQALEEANQPRRIPNRIQRLSYLAFAWMEKGRTLLVLDRPQAAETALATSLGFCAEGGMPLCSHPGLLATRERGKALIACGKPTEGKAILVSLEPQGPQEPIASIAMSGLAEFCLLFPEDLDRLRHLQTLKGWARSSCLAERGAWRPVLHALASLEPNPDPSPALRAFLELLERMVL